MTWKKRVAKEWIWLLVTTFSVLLLMGAFSYWKGMSFVGSLDNILEGGKRGVTGAREVFSVGIGVVYFFRFTLWSIKQLKKGKR